LDMPLIKTIKINVKKISSRTKKKKNHKMKCSNSKEFVKRSITYIYRNDLITPSCRSSSNPILPEQ